jgi:hypothetical protein
MLIHCPFHNGWITGGKCKTEWATLQVIPVTISILNAQKFGQLLIAWL